VDVKVRPAVVVEYPALTVVVDEARAAELGMTVTEARHVQQLASGWHQTEMAAAAVMSETGMNMRIHRVRVRYNLRTNDQLVAWAYQHRLLVVNGRG
jgi:hypothetical protein